MRVLMLTQSYPPIIGGEERHVQDLSTALASRGHSVSVATLADVGAGDVRVEDGVRVYRMQSTVQRIPGIFSEPTRVHAPPVPDPEVGRALRHVLEEERPDVVHAHNWLVHSFLPLKRRNGAKLVVSLHDYSLACTTKKLLRYGMRCSGPGLTKCPGCVVDHYGRMKGPVTLAANIGMSVVERRQVDLFIPVSRAVAAGNGLVGSSVPFTVIPNFLSANSDVDGPNVDALRRQLPDEPYFLFVGAYAAYKGVDVLLAAYAGLRRAPPLVLIGYDTGEYPVATVDLPAGVTAVKNWPHAAVMAAWQGSLAGIVPSVWAEPFGLVALEAMSAGRPVIASSIGGLGEVVRDGETGIVVQPGDVGALRGAMEWLARDEERRQIMGRAARRQTGDFSADVVVPRIERAYQDVVRHCSPPPRSAGREGTPTFPTV